MLKRLARKFLRQLLRTPGMCLAGSYGGVSGVFYHYGPSIKNQPCIRFIGWKKRGKNRLKEVYFDGNGDILL